MVIEFLKGLNWVDVFVVILLIRITYIAVKTGLSVEVFKSLGTVCAVYLALHYYINSGKFLNVKLSWEGNYLPFLNLVCFLILASFGYFVFVIIRRILIVLIKMEAVSRLNRWGAVILGVLRWALFTSLIFYTINVSNIDYFRNSLVNSYSMQKMFPVAPRVYAFLWNNLMFRFMEKETFNKRVYDFTAGYPK